MMAWNTKDLTPIKISDELKARLKLQGQLLELSFVGDSSMILLK